MKHPFRLPLLAFVLTVAVVLARPVHAGSSPVLSSVGTLTVAEGAALTVTITATDADGDTLTYFPPVLPPGAHFDVPTHTFTWTPTFTQAGTYPGITFGVSDGTTYVSETIAITVSDVNRPPVASSGGPYAGTTGAPVVFASTGSTDPEGTTLASSWNFGDGSTGTGALVPHRYAIAGTYTVTLRVSDGSATTEATSIATVTAATPEPSHDGPHGPAVRVELTPSAPTMASGTSQAFAATAVDASGNRWDATSATTFSDTDPRGSFTGSAYSAGAAGTWTVQGDYGNLLGTASVTVVPGPIARIVVNPSSSPEEMVAGSKRTFTAQAFDAASNIIPSTEFAWLISGDLGTISATGTLAASQVGTGSVLASVGDVSGSSSVHVSAAALAESPSTSKPTKRTSSTSTKATPTGVVEGTETQNTSSDTTSPATSSGSKSTCANIRGWGWVGVLVGYLLVLIGVLYATRRVRGLVYWILPLALTAAILWGFYQYRCGGAYPWFPWLAVIGGLIVALFRPLPPEPPYAPPPPPQASAF